MPDFECRATERESAEIDLSAAEFYLARAREAHESGNTPLFIASRKLILVALCVPDQPPMRR
jgi:hypothetical protein